MLDEYFQADTDRADDLDGLLSLTDLSVFDMGKYTMRLLAGSDRLYKIKNDRSSKLLETMANYRKEKRFCDVVLCVKGERYPAHKIVLASASSFFASMFGEPSHIEARTTEDIDLTKLVPCSFSMGIILDFIYTSEIHLNDQCVSRGGNR